VLPFIDADLKIISQQTDMKIISQQAVFHSVQSFLLLNINGSDKFRGEIDKKAIDRLRC
jgi:hypothetical protein